MNIRIVKFLYSLALIVSIAFILFPSVLMADTCCVKIDGQFQGELTQGLKCDGMEDYEAALSTIVNSRVEKFKPFKFEKKSNRLSPLLQMAMFNDEDLKLDFKHFQISPVGLPEHFFTVRLSFAKVVGVQGSQDEALSSPTVRTEKITLIYDQISWVHELSGVRYDSCHIGWTQDRKGAWTGACQ